MGLHETLGKPQKTAGFHFQIAAHNGLVAGSSPARPTSEINSLKDFLEASIFSGTVSGF